MTTPVSLLGDRREALVATTLDLLAFDTANPPGDTRGIVEYVESYFDNLGIETERITAERTKPNVLATIPGESAETLLFNGHLDTVPYDPDGWTHDPLGERVGDRIYGRGAVDMKGGVAAMLEVARAFVDAGEAPPVTLEFAFVSDEEIGGDAGVAALLEADRLRADACLIGEPTCSNEAHSVTVADRGSIWLTLEATGQAAHGSRPTLGANAIDRLWEAIETIRTRLADQRLSLEPAVETIVEESIPYYAPTMGESTARRLFERPTANLGTIEGGAAINRVPKFARAELDVRLTAGVDSEVVLASIRERVDEHEGVSVAEANWSVGTYETPGEPVVEATTAVAESTLGGPIFRRSATGGGDAKRLRTAGIPTIEFAAGPDTAHACDEYTTVEALGATAAVYAKLPAAYTAARNDGIEPAR